MDEKVKDEPQSEYTDLIVDALFAGTAHRQIIQDQISLRESLAIKGLIDKVIAARLRNKDKNWWKDELIQNNNDKGQIIIFSGLNMKTIKNRIGTTCKEETKHYCLSHIDNISKYVKSLQEYPNYELKITSDKKIITLDTLDTYLLLKSIIAIAKQISGGTQSQVGKKVGTKYLIKLFESLGISANSKDDFYYEISRKSGGREVDGLIYYKNKIIKIEIKLLGMGNPELGDQPMGRGVDIFIVDQLSLTMEKENRDKGIEVIKIKNAPQKLYEYLKKKGLAVKPPKSV